MLRRMCILIASLMLTTTAWAQNIITVDNNVPSGAMYLDLQQAIDAANNGDIIYVSGSETRYGDITIDTRLTLIGTGHKRNPGIQIPLVSRIASVSFSEGFGLTSDSSKIIGFQIDFSILSNGYDDIEIRRNILVSSDFLSITTSGWIIEHNIFRGSLYVAHASNITIRNNIFAGGFTYNSSQPTVIITQNLFLSGFNIFSGVSFALISNNIFYGRAPQGCETSTFNNNLTF